MRIRGRRRDAAANPSLPIPPPPYSDSQPPPPPSPPLTDGRPESSDAHPDGSPTAFRERIAPSSALRSSPPPPASSSRFYEECDDADLGDTGRYAQLSDILKRRPGRSYRSSLPECTSEAKASGFHSDAEPKNKLELLLAVCSNTDLLESPSDECKKVEICSCSEDNESTAISDRSKRANSITKRLSRRGKKSRTSWGVEMRHQFSLQRPTKRTNNCHWTSAEVNQLVDGVSTLGVGRWTELKSTYFETSIRTAQHLKDKWRNLLMACGLQVGRKKKVDAIRITNDLRDRIIALHKKHISTRKGRLDGRSANSVSRMS